MPITLLNPDPASTIAIEALESRLGLKLPPSFREFLTTVSNGGEVEPVAAMSVASVGLVAILGAGRGDHLDLEARVDQYQGDRLPSGLVPVADLEGGNLLCLSLRSSDFGTVWFWDHELEPTSAAAIQVAGNFEEFLADLAPLPDSELVPEEVTDVWVDPGLLAELEDDQS